KVLQPPRGSRQHTSSSAAVSLPSSQWVDIRELRRAVASQGPLVVANSSGHHSSWPPGGDLSTTSRLAHSFYSSLPLRDSSVHGDSLAPAVTSAGWTPLPSTCPTNIYAQLSHSLVLTTQPLSLQQSHLGFVYYLPPGVGTPTPCTDVQTTVPATATTTTTTATITPGGPPAGESSSIKVSSTSKRVKKGQADGLESSEDIATQAANTSQEVADLSPAQAPASPPLPRLIAHVALIQQLMAGLLDDRPCRHLQTLRALMALLTHSRQTLCKWAGLTLRHHHHHHMGELMSLRQSQQECFESAIQSRCQESQKTPRIDTEKQTQEQEFLTSGQPPPGLDCLLMSVRVSLLHLIAGDLLTSADVPVRSSSAECLACLAHLASTIVILTGPAVFRHAIDLATKTGRFHIKLISLAGKFSSDGALRVGEELVRCGAHRILQATEAFRASKEKASSTSGRDASGKASPVVGNQRIEQQHLQTIEECGEWTVQELEECESAGAVVKCCLVLLSYMTADSVSAVRLSSLSAILSLIPHLTEDVALQSLQRPSFPPATPNPISRCRVLLRLHLAVSTRSALTAAVEATIEKRDTHRSTGAHLHAPLTSQKTVSSSPPQISSSSCSSVPPSHPSNPSSSSLGHQQHQQHPSLSSSSSMTSGGRQGFSSPLAAVVSALASVGERAHTSHHTVAAQQLQSEIAKSPLAIGWLLSSLDDSSPQVRALGFIVLRSLLEFYTQTAREASALSLSRKKGLSGAEVGGEAGGEDSSAPSVTGGSSFPNAVQLLIWDYLSDPVHAVQESAASALPCLSLSIPLRDGAFRRAIFPLLHARKKQTRLLFLKVLPLCKTFNARALKVEVQGLLRCPYAREDESEISACFAEILYAAYHNLWSLEEGLKELLNQGPQGIQEKGEDNEKEEPRKLAGGGELPQGIPLDNNGDLRKKEEDMLQVFRVLATPKSRKRTQLTAVTDWTRRDWELRLLLLMRRRIGEEEERTRQAGIFLLSNNGHLVHGTAGREESLKGTIDTDMKAECVVKNQRGDLQHSITLKLPGGPTSETAGVGEHVAREGNNKRRKILMSDTFESLSVLEKRGERDGRLSRFLPLDVFLTLHYVSLQFPLAIHHPLPTFPIERQMEAADCLLSQLDGDEHEEEEKTAGQSLPASLPSVNQGNQAITASREEISSSQEPKCSAASCRREDISHINGTSTSQGQGLGGSTIRERGSFSGLEKRYPLLTRKKRSPYLSKGSRESQQGSHFSFLHRRALSSSTSQAASTTGPCSSVQMPSSVPPCSSSAVSSTPLLLERDTWELLHSDVPCRFGVLRQALRSMHPVLAFVSSPFFSGNKRRRIRELDDAKESVLKDPRGTSSMVSSSLSRFSSLSSSSPSEEERSSNNPTSASPSSSSMSSSSLSKKRKQDHEAHPSSGQRDGRVAKQLATESTLRADSTSSVVDVRSKSLIGRPSNKPGRVKSLSGGGRRDPLAISKHEPRNLGEREEYDDEGHEGLSLPLFPFPSLADSLLLFKVKMERRHARKQWLLLSTQALSHAATAPALPSRETVERARAQSWHSREDKMSQVKGKGLSSFFSLSSSTKPLSSRSLSAHTSLLSQKPKGLKKMDEKKTGIGTMSSSLGSTNRQQPLDGGPSLKREDVCLASCATSSLLSSIWPRTKTHLSIYPVHSPTASLVACEDNRVSPDHNSLFSSASTLSLGRGRRRRSSSGKRERGELRWRQQRREREIVQAFLKDGEDFSFPNVSSWKKRQRSSRGEVEEEEEKGWGETDLETGGRWVSSWATRLKKETGQDKESHYQEGRLEEKSNGLHRGCEVPCLSWRQIVNMCLPEESWENFLLLEKTWEVLRKKWRQKKRAKETSSSISSSATPLNMKHSESPSGNTSPKKTSLFSSFLSLSLHFLSEQQKGKEGDITSYSLLHSSSSSPLSRLTESILPRSFCLWRNELISSRLQALAATALIFSPSLVLNRYELLPDRRLLSLLPASSFSHINVDEQDPLHPLDFLDRCVPASSISASERDSQVVSSIHQGKQPQETLPPYQVNLEKLFTFLSNSLSYFFVVHLHEPHWRRSLEAYMQEGAVAATGLAGLYPIVIRNAGGENENRNSASRHLDCFYTVKGEKVSSAKYLEGRGGLIQEALNDLLPIPVRFGCSKGAVVWLEARLTLPGEQLKRMTSECCSFAEKEGEEDEVKEKKNKDMTDPALSNTQQREEPEDTEGMSRPGGISRSIGTTKLKIRGGGGEGEGKGEGQEKDKKEGRDKKEAGVCKGENKPLLLHGKSMSRSSHHPTGVAGGTTGEEPGDFPPVVPSSDSQKAPKDGQKLNCMSFLQRPQQNDRENKDDEEKDKHEMVGEEGDGGMITTTTAAQLNDRRKASTKIQEKRSSAHLSPAFYLCVRVPVALELSRKKDGEQQTKASLEDGMHGAVSGDEVKGGDESQQLGQQHVSHNQERLDYFPTTSLMKQRSSPLVRAVLANFYTSVCSSSHSSSLMFSSTSEDRQGVSPIGSSFPLSGNLRPSSPSLTPSSSGGTFSPQATSLPGEKKEESHLGVIGSAPVAPSSPVRHSRCGSSHRRKRKIPPKACHGKLGGLSGGCGFASRILGLHLKKPRNLVKNLLSLISASESPSTGLHSSPTVTCCLENSHRTSCSTDISAFPSSSLSCFSSPMDSPELSFPPRTRLTPPVVPLFSPGAELGNCLHNASEKRSNSLLRRSQRRVYGSQGDYPCRSGGFSQEDKESGVSLYRIDLEEDEWMGGGEGPWQQKKDKIEVRVTFPLSLDAPTSGPFPVDVVVCALFEGDKNSRSVDYRSSASGHDGGEGIRRDVSLLVPTSDVKRLWLQPTWLG
ncbi:heat repeat-containing protein, partial [Cystoisospora suis]